MKIAVYAIAKNEEAFVKRFCKSVKDADLILIADTGSTDKTVKLAKKYGAVVYDISVRPWRFDVAREISLSLVPADYDVCVCLDLDEVMEDGWREEIERLWKEDTTQLRYKFDSGHGIIFYRDKVHSRFGYRWKHACHEVLVPVTGFTENSTWTDKLLARHLPDETKSRGQYLDMLAASAKEDPTCFRSSLYYGRELTFYRRWPEAILELKKYLALPGATWANERAYAMRMLYKAHAEIDDKDQALKWARLSVAEDPTVRDTWVALSEATYSKNMWDESYFAAMSALNISQRSNLYTEDAINWQGRPYDLASVAAWNLGFKEKALEFTKKALEFTPTDERLNNNLKIMIGEQT
jgi:glycosyltransferase involved in cell wall biosynthesis